MVCQQLRRRKGTVAVISDRTATILIFVVTTVWAVNFAAAAWPGSTYRPDGAINGAFMVIVGGAFVLRYKDADKK